MTVSWFKLTTKVMVWLLYFIILFNLGCFLFVDSDADCNEFIAEKCQREGFFKKLMPMKPNDCVAICEQVNTCFAVNYFMLNATCLLLNRTMPESKLIKATKCWYKSVRSPPKEFIDNDPCYQKKCMWDEICMQNTTTHLAECYPLCITPPSIPGAIKETVEVVEVGQNYTYRCQDGLLGKRDQNPTVTCLRDGHWTMTNFACVCKTPPAIPGAINETSEVEVGQNYVYRCQGGLFVKGDQNPTVTCQHDGSWTSTNFMCVKQNWTKDTIYPNNIHKSDVISTEAGIDLLACMQQCDDKPNSCLSFFYDNHTSHCVLSSSFRRGLPSSLQSSDGMVYYTAPSNSCDMEYKNVSLGGSYFCIKFHTEGRPFNEAMKLCESEKAKLLVVTTKAEIDDINKLILIDWNPFGILSAWAFLGFLETNEGYWVSWDGEAVSPYWNLGQPDNWFQNEECAALSYSVFALVKYTADVPCNSNFYFICHKNVCIPHKVNGSA